MNMSCKNYLAKDMLITTIGKEQMIRSHISVSGGDFGNRFLKDSVKNNSVQKNLNNNYVKRSRNASPRVSPRKNKDDSSVKVNAAFTVPSKPDQNSEALTMTRVRISPSLYHKFGFFFSHCSSCVGLGLIGTLAFLDRRIGLANLTLCTALNVYHTVIFYKKSFIKNHGIV